MTKYRTTDAAIFSRFADTITGIFAGHTHNDQYVTIVDENNNPTAVRIPSPSRLASLRHTNTLSDSRRLRFSTSSPR